MKFRLYLDLRGDVLILNEQQTPESRFTLLSERDPDVPLEFKIGYAYFNPLLTMHIYLCTPEGLMGYQNSKSPIKHSKAETARLARGWFELPPQTLSARDLDQETVHLIDHSPGLVGVIMQRLRQLGLRISSEQQFTQTNDWWTWLAAQSLPVRPLVRKIFNSLLINSSKLFFTKENRYLMLTGEMPELLFSVLIRQVEIRQVHVYKQQLYESMEQSFLMPENIIKEGTNAIVEYITKIQPDWAQLIPEATAENQKEISAATSVSSGPLIYYKPEYASEYTLLNAPKEDWDREAAPSIIDILNKAVNNPQ